VDSQYIRLIKQNECSQIKDNIMLHLQPDYHLIIAEEREVANGQIRQQPATSPIT
jgi:hypothetical protein